MSPALCSHSPRASPRRGSEGGKLYLQVCMLASSERKHIFACADEQILCETWEERDNGGDGCCGEKVLGIEQRMCKY